MKKLLLLTVGVVMLSSCGNMGRNEALKAQNNQRNLPFPLLPLPSAEYRHEKRQAHRPSKDGRPALFRILFQRQDERL